MLSQEASMEIRILARQGLGIKEIVRQTGYSRNTIRKYLREPETVPQYTPRPSRPGKLTPFEGYIGQRLEHAAPDWIPAAVLYREIQLLGYTGSERLVRQYVSTLKPIVQPEPANRFETAPGQQMQVDWATFRRGKHRLCAFVAVLGFSRMGFVRFVPDEQFKTMVHCHEAAFDYFDGVAHEILYDNMKTVVLARDAYGRGQHRLHPGLWDFAKHHGFIPRLCAPYRARTKGKVERFIHYLRHSFYIPYAAMLKQDGREVDISGANEAVQRWLLMTANCRMHSDLQARPVDLWQAEQPLLQSIQRSWGQPRSSLPMVDRYSASVRLDQQPLHHDLSIYDAYLEMEP